MAAEGETEARIVRHDLLAFRGRRKRRQALGGRRIERIAARRAGRDPAREAPVSRERLERAGGGERAQVAFIQT